jgi:hypothetical protein
LLGNTGNESENQPGTANPKTYGGNFFRSVFMASTTLLIALFILKAVFRLLNISLFSLFEQTKLGVELKRRINIWLKTWDSKNPSEYEERHPEIAERLMRDAAYSYQIQERNKLYRIMDIALLITGIRHIPPECICDKDCTYPPVILNENHVEIKQESITQEGKPTRNATAAIFEHPINKALLDSWKAYFTEICNLIRHDDILNWQKFHYVMVIFGVIISAFVLSFNGQASETFGQMARILLSLTGIAISIVADRTFQEGLRCLRGHRRKLLKLEERGLTGSTYLFGTCPFNQRDGLELGPAIMFLISTGMLLIAISQRGLW